MIGGKPNQAYFFYGYAGKFFSILAKKFKDLTNHNLSYIGDELLFMDPHEVQPYVPNFIENMDDSSYHTNKIWKMKFSQLDPSIALVVI